MASIQVCDQVVDDGCRALGVARAVFEKAHTTQRSHQRIRSLGMASRTVPDRSKAAACADVDRTCPPSRLQSNAMPTSIVRDDPE